MDWFLYDNGLRHKRIKTNLYHLNVTDILLEYFPEQN